jgi:hypothetical protein
VEFEMNASVTEGARFCIRKRKKNVQITTWKRVPFLSEAESKNSG